MPVEVPKKKYAELDTAVRVVVDAAIVLLMEYTRMRGNAEGLELLEKFSPEENKQAIIKEFDEGEIRLVAQGDLLMWECYLPEKDAYQQMGAGLRIKPCPTRN